MSEATPWESSGSVPGSLPGPSAEAGVFWHLRWNLLRTVTRVALRTSGWHLISVAAASAILWMGLFLLFYEGFAFIHQGLVHEGLRAQLVHAVFNVFFLALTVMLFFSSAIILYGALYRGQEVAFLLSTPARQERIVIYKFQESVFFSGWGFILLGSPMLVSYGLVAGAPWYYYALLGPFILTFVALPTALGAITCLVVVRLLPAIRLHALVALAVIVLAAAGMFAWQVLAYQNRDMTTMTWFQDVLSRLEFSEQRLLPSWWLSSGLLEAAHPAGDGQGLPSWGESLMFLAVLTSNALLLQILLAAVGGRMFRASYSALAGISPNRRVARINVLDRWAFRLTTPLPRVVRHFIVKDLRLFRRDPMQWSQFAIFFGLLSLYFFNIRRFDYAGVMAKWVTIMSFMNLAVVGLILSTFTTRFIFPMVSLEGRRFWILGTAPIERDAILWGKFWFACAATLPPCAGLVLLSDLMLGVAERSFVILAVHQFACAVLCLGLSGLAVGLGARLPNLREPSPSKIAAGFGGTLNLVLSSLYIVGVVLATAVPSVFWAESQWFDGLSRSGWLSSAIGLGSTGGLVLGLLGTLLLGTAATAYPLWIGFRAFRRLEF